MRWMQGGSMAEPGEITTLLEAARRGDPPARDALFERLYPELRRIARARMRHTDQRVVLDTTSLVHECYLRLPQLDRLAATDRAHFLAYAARVMRSVVVDIAREQQALRRGGGQRLVTLDTAIGRSEDGKDTEALRVHDALEELAALDERLVRVVEMRYFAGLSNADIAEALGIGLRTVERDWERARSFLYVALEAS
jgi:RNA polymerase sigma factor (TIGR02999 family)